MVSKLLISVVYYIATYFFVSLVVVVVKTVIRMVRQTMLIMSMYNNYWLITLCTYIHLNSCDELDDVDSPSDNDMANGKFVFCVYLHTLFIR